MTENSELFCDGNQGIYIPEIFADMVDRKYIINPREVYKQLTSLLNGPDQEYYWESWEYVLDNIELRHPDNNKTYVLYQDMDLWIVPVDELDQIEE